MARSDPRPHGKSRAKGPDAPLRGTFSRGERGERHPSRREERGSLDGRRRPPVRPSSRDSVPTPLPTAWTLGACRRPCRLASSSRVARDRPPADALDRVRASGRLGLRQRRGGGRPVRLPGPRLAASHDRVRGRADAEPGRRGSAPSRSLRKASGTGCSRPSTPGGVDVVVNGYEWTEPRGPIDYLATRPYYVYQLQLMAPRAGRSASLGRPARRPGRAAASGRSACWAGRPPTRSPPSTARGCVEVVWFNGATDAMMAATNGQIDATLQDLPAARLLPRPSSRPRTSPARPSAGAIT